MKKALAAAAGTVIVLALLGPALTADFFHSRWSDGAGPDVGAVAPDSMADVTVLGAGIAETDAAAPIAVADAGDATPEEAARFADLLRIDDRPGVSIAPTLSRRVLASHTVTKIGYGRAEQVEIVTTPSGVYSTDGLDSTHVLYPGISLDRNAPERIMGLFALIGGNWIDIVPVRAGSFTHYGAGYGVSYRTNSARTCIAGEGYRGCF
ncbi:MAG: hypothetical protein KKH72_00890 [Alphaproteobacteria bacterium]|nr:hypothetical protein [Alphaproteobacteria bacterium]